jgi:hypothetical protein
MTIDYRGLRLIEQVLEAEERRDHYTPKEDFFHREYIRLHGLLCEWVADKLAAHEPGEAFERANRMLATFRVSQ